MSLKQTDHWSGLALSVASEHIENAGEDVYALSKDKEKQDCELKPFKRLAPKIKNAFPQLKIVYCWTVFMQHSML
ncbi:MAG TPA: hypothetical protein VHO70_04645 [Chitinispirillaceae bacterium]|nr:hypothetical protein [Chitinispirillaceae bacterium]